MNGTPPSIAVIGAGPAGLMAAEVLSAGGAAVTVYDRMPSVGRKFLMAGRGGLNLTHSEPFETFAGRYGGAAASLRPMLDALPPAALIAWANGLGQETFVGSSGRVFPRTMKASPLLRAWLARLNDQGVRFALRHDWLGWVDDGVLRFRTDKDELVRLEPAATVLALGGASWPKLGSNGAWVRILEKKGIAVSPLRSANCGFTMPWSDVFRQRFAGQPLKNASFRFDGRSVRGEATITQYGIEGGAIYALSSAIRETIQYDGNAMLEIDLRPEVSEEQLLQRLKRPRGKDSLTNHLRKTLKLSPLEINLLREVHGAAFVPDATMLAKHVKHTPVNLAGVQKLDRAISTAGGICFAALDETLMLKALPGAYAVGEMLDWEAPTGGYLLQACFATGAFAAHAILHKIAP
ncbi:MAG TPA: TIGR03862 family flavoprotein [Rhizomicrobium sp.]